MMPKKQNKLRHGSLQILRGLVGLERTRYGGEEQVSAALDIKGSCRIKTVAYQLQTCLDLPGLSSHLRHFQSPVPVSSFWNNLQARPHHISRHHIDLCPSFPFSQHSVVSSIVTAVTHFHAAFSAMQRSTTSPSASLNTNPFHRYTPVASLQVETCVLERK